MRRNSGKSGFFRAGFLPAAIIVLSVIIYKWGQGVFENAAEIIQDFLGKSASYIMACDLYCEENDLQQSDGTAPVVTTENETQDDFALPELSVDTHEKDTEQPTEQSETKKVQAALPSSSGSIVEAAAGVYPANKLTDYDYVLSHFYVVPSVTSLGRDVLDLPAMAATDLRMEKDSSVPQILIYHTHSQEWFSDTNENGKTIVDVGSYLTRILTEQYGYNVIHLTDTFDIINGVLDRSEAYSYSDQKITKVLEENPTIQVVIDLHRDGVDASRHFVTDINGKSTAKIMLFNGISYTNKQGNIDYLYNPYLTENLAMTYKMYLAGSVMYPDFIRCIFISGYRYNMHHRARSMLIEAGAQTNTYEEVCNAMEPLARMLDGLLTSG